MKGDCDCLDVTVLFGVHDVVLFAPVPVGNPGSQGEVSHCVCKGPSYCKASLAVISLLFFTCVVFDPLVSLGVDDVP